MSSMVKEFGYEYNATVDKELLSQTEWLGTDEQLWGAYCLRSGRDALKAIAREHPNKTVFLPALCCDSMVTPFEQYGCKIVFYPLTNSLTADYAVLTDCLQKIDDQALLLFYDYFGIPMFTELQLRHLKSRGKDLILIEDVTHNLLSFPKMKPDVTYRVASLRKWTNIPDGGLLWTKEQLKNKLFLEDCDFACRRLSAQCLRTEYFASGNESIKTQYRKIFSEVSSLLDDAAMPIKMSVYSYRLAAKTDWKKIRQIRRENAAVLTDIFRESRSVQLINDGVEISDLYVPIFVKNRDDIQKILSAKGIFNTVIWPLRDEQISRCPVAKEITSCMLAVPCDQRYTKEDMAYIGQEIVRVIHG